MAITSQKISNHPLSAFSDIERTADVVDFDVNDTNKTCSIHVLLRYADGDTDITAQFPQRVYTLVATNSISITVRDEDFNPILDKDGNEQEMPAYDYVEMLVRNPVAAVKMLAFFVILNDGYGFFNE